MIPRGGLASVRRLRRLAFCGLSLVMASGTVKAADEPPHSAELDAAIIRQAKRNGVPEKLVRRIVMRESKYNARARNHSFWGLMQISYPTARSMGFKGSPDQLLNPFVNLTYAVPYLANAFVIAGKREDAAVRLYASGYYATAKSRGLLGALRTAETAPVSGIAGEPDVPNAEAVATLTPEAAPNYGIFGALFGPAEQPRSAEQLVATAPQAAPPSTAVDALPSSKNGDAVAMTAGASGAAEMPRKWMKDGGVSSIARGEQTIEQASVHVAVEAGAARSTHGHAHKVTTFAALDQTPPTAQAYAGSTDAQDPRYTQSQAAITQATSGAAAPAASIQPAPAEAAADAPTKVAKHTKPHHVARKETKAKVAATDVASDGSASDGSTTADGESAGKKPRRPRHATVKKPAAFLRADADAATLQPAPATAQ